MSRRWIALTLAACVPLSAGAQEPGDANIFVKLSKKIVPSVVNISTTMTIKNSGSAQSSPEDILRKFFGDILRGNPSYRGPRGGDEDDDDDSQPLPQLPPGTPPKNLPKAQSLGTGFIIDSSGLILTNNHVVADADEIKISFTESLDEKPTDGEVVGRDTELDVALIRVKSSREMTAVSFGDSDALEVGEYVIAVGNPFGQGHSVTHGIISAKGRLAPDFPLANYLQTDAPINPGNSGGPLVNLKGEVIGINNAIDQRAVGIGFAIPISLVKKVLPQLRAKGTVSRGYIGVLVNEMVPELAAQLKLPKDSQAPAAAAGHPAYSTGTDFPARNGRSGAESASVVEAGGGVGYLGVDYPGVRRIARGLAQRKYEDRRLLRDGNGRGTGVAGAGGVGAAAIAALVQPSSAASRRAGGAARDRQSLPPGKSRGRGGDGAGRGRHVHGDGLDCAARPAAGYRSYRAAGNAQCLPAGRDCEQPRCGVSADLAFAGSAGDAGNAGGLNG